MTPQTWTTIGLILVLAIYEIVANKSDKKRFSSLNRAKEACEKKTGRIIKA